MIAALGPRGTFSHEAAASLFRTEPLLLPSIKKIVEGVYKGEFIGVVPIENSEVGSIGLTLDALNKFPVFITGEAWFRIRHHLASNVTSTEFIKRVYAHPQAHEQCSEFLEELGVTVIHTESNAVSAELAAKDQGSAAITTENAARLQNLVIIREDVQNSEDNATRFVSLEKERKKGSSPFTQCSLIIDPETDRPGLLYEILGPFAQRGINLSRIISRPSKRGRGSYLFFIDCSSTNFLCEVIDEVGKIALVRELGCYSSIGGI